jgi:hypothetical protein
LNLSREHSHSAYFDNAIVTSGMAGVTSRVQRWLGDYDLDGDMWASIKSMSKRNTKKTKNNETNEKV